MSALRPPRTAWHRFPGLRAHGLLLLAVLLGAALPAARPDPAVAQSKAVQRELVNKKKQIKQLQFEKEQVEQRLDRFRQSEEEQLGRIAHLVKETKAIKRQERELAGQGAVQRRRKRKLESGIRNLTGRIAQSQALVAGHMRRLYRLSKASDSATLISLARYKDFFRDSRYLGVVIRIDRKAIAEFERLHRELDEKREAAEQTLLRLATLEKGLVVQRRELNAKQKELRASVAKMRKNRKLYARYLDELEKTRKGMEAALISLERKSSDTLPPAPPPEPALLRGNLPAPAPGRIIAGFGEQDPRYALKKFQRGLVIRVAEAAPVRAVASGRVVHAGPFRGYQELVVLDHGKGLFTVYGHLEKLKVKRGGWAQAGAALGEATYQPIGSAYDIYFEIRMNGKPEDPSAWLRPGSLAGQPAAAASG